MWYSSPVLGRTLDAGAMVTTKKDKVPAGTELII